MSVPSKLTGKANVILASISRVDRGGGFSITGQANSNFIWKRRGPRMVRVPKEAAGVKAYSSDFTIALRALQSELRKGQIINRTGQSL